MQGNPAATYAQSYSYILRYKSKVRCRKLDFSRSRRFRHKTQQENSGGGSTSGDAAFSKLELTDG